MINQNTIFFSSGLKYAEQTSLDVIMDFFWFLSTVISGSRPKFSNLIGFIVQNLAVIFIWKNDRQRTQSRNKGIPIHKLRWDIIERVKDAHKRSEISSSHVNFQADKHIKLCKNMLSSPLKRCKEISPKKQHQSLL